MAVTRFVRLFLQSAALGLGAWLAIKGEISAGAIFAASFLVARALSPLEQMLGSWRSLEQARNAWRNLDSLLQRAPPTALTHLPLPLGALEVDRLTVMNPAGDRAILQGVSFRVAAGEIVAIVGPSGAGKSTLVRTIAGAGGAYSGAIRFDGAEMKDFEPERLARRIGYSPQETTLFSGTVKENIARFSGQISEHPEEVDGRVIDAAKACQAHDMILRLPEGYDTPLGWGGRGLSAGQAQRIALARALFGSPTLLLLDEPNAHLDSDGEAMLVNTLRQQKALGVTVLIVAHRTGVLSAVDRLMVLREGRLEIFGPRDEVLARLAPPPAAPPPVAAMGL
jgi:ATP-binding cassette subfamily C protein